MCKNILVFLKVGFWSNQAKRRGLNLSNFIFEELDGGGD